MMAPRGSSWWHCSKLRGSRGEQKQLKQLKQCVMLCHFVSFCVILICPTCKGLPACRLAQSAQVGTVFVPLSEQLQQPIKLLAFIKNLPRMCIHFAYLCITLHQFVNHVICSIVGWFVSAFRPPQIESRSMLQHFVHQPLKFKIMLKAREQLTTSEWKCPENRQIFEKDRCQQTKK